MTEVTDDAGDPTPMQLLTWAEDQGITVGEMRAQVARNRAAVLVTADRIARMIKESGPGVSPDRAQPGEGRDPAGDGPVHAGN